MPRQTVTHVDEPIALGRRLRQARVAAGMTQTALSFPGCSIGYISRIEIGTRVPSLQVIRELAQRLGVSEEWLARGGEEPMQPESQRLADADLALRLDDADGAEELYRGLRDSSAARIRARALAGLGQAAFRRDDAAGAVELLEQAYATDDGLDDPAAAETLGRAYAILGREEEAIAVFLRHHVRATEQANTVDRLRFSVLLANALIDAGRFGHAAEVIGSAIAEQHDPDPLTLARLSWTQSRFHALRLEFDSAARYAQRAIALLDAGEHVLYQARAYQVLAHIELDRNDPERAYELIAEGRSRLGSLGTPHDHAKFAIEEVRALAALGRLDEAAALALGPTTMAAGHAADRGRCFAEIAALSAQRGDRARAIELYELALELLGETPSRYAVEACTRCAELLEAEGRAADALELYKRAAGVQLEISR